MRKFTLFLLIIFSSQFINAVPCSATTKHDTVEFGQYDAYKYSDVIVYRKTELRTFLVYMYSVTLDEKIDISRYIDEYGILKIDFYPFFIKKYILPKLKEKFVYFYGNELGTYYYNEFYRDVIVHRISSIRHIPCVEYYKDTKQLKHCQMSLMVMVDNGNKYQGLFETELKNL